MTTAIRPLYDTTHQDIEVPMRLPTPNKRMHWQRKKELVKAQRRATREALERCCIHPRLPIRVTLIRVGSPRLDSDRAALSLAAVRDEVARWALRVPFEVVGSDGRMRAPRAPDGINDPIEWRYGPHQKAPKGLRGYQAARIIIEEL